MGRKTMLIRPLRTFALSAIGALMLGACAGTSQPGPEPPTPQPRVRLSRCRPRSRH